MAYRNFTETDDEYIIKNYGKQTYTNMAKALNKMQSSIFSRIGILVRKGKLNKQNGKYIKATNYAKTTTISNTSPKSNMKIIINEGEFYMMAIPTEIDIRELPMVADRLNRISKLLGRDIILESISAPQLIEKEKKIYKSSHIREYARDRTLAIQVLKIHYLGSKEEKEAIAKKYNEVWDNIVKGINQLRKKWDIKSNEVGLKQFPTKQNHYEFNLNKEKWKI